MTNGSSDLITRDWSQWWLSWPKWARIFCWTILGSLLLQAIIVLRVAIGLIEADEVKQLRQRGARITYPWDNLELVSIRPPNSLIPAYKTLRKQYRLLVAGLVGRSAASVASIDMEHGTDSDLKLIGGHFHGIKRLQFWKSDFAIDSLRFLDACHQIEYLDLSYTDLNDQGVAMLVRHLTLRELNLGATLITDLSIESIRTLPSLESVDLYVTDVSPEAIEMWRANHHQARLKIKNGRDENPIELGGIIRWSDGSRSGNFLGNWQLFIEGPMESVETQTIDCSWTFLGRNDLTWSSLSHLQDGDYRFTLKLGSFESEPVTIRISDGHPSNEQFELRLPVTKKQALLHLQL